MDAVQDNPGSEIRVIVKIFGGLRTHAFRELDAFPVPKGATIESLLSLMSTRSALLVEKIEDGLSAGYLNTLVNGRNIRFLEERATQLQDGDTIAFLPPVGGG